MPVQVRSLLCDSSALHGRSREMPWPHGMPWVQVRMNPDHSSQSHLELVGSPVSRCCQLKSQVLEKEIERTKMSALRPQSDVGEPCPRLGSAGAQDIRQPLLHSHHQACPHQPRVSVPKCCQSHYAPQISSSPLGSLRQPPRCQAGLCRWHHARGHW